MHDDRQEKNFSKKTKKRTNVQSRSWLDKQLHKSDWMRLPANILAAQFQLHKRQNLWLTYSAFRPLQSQTQKVPSQDFLLDQNKRSTLQWKESQTGGDVKNFPGCDATGDAIDNYEYA